MWFILSCTCTSAASSWIPNQNEMADPELRKDEHVRCPQESIRGWRGSVSSSKSAREVRGEFLMQRTAITRDSRMAKRVTVPPSSKASARSVSDRRQNRSTGLQGRFFGAQSLNFCSWVDKGESGYMAGSTSFGRNPAWGRSRVRKDVQCVLTRRTRLQYMQCNGVGGSTC